MSSFGVPTLVERVLRFSYKCAKPLGLACLLTASTSGSLTGESLGKGPVYFYDRYGSQKSSQTIVGYKVFTHFKYSMIPIEQPCLIRKYARHGVSLDVLLTDPGLEAIWVRITLKEKFTGESLAAVLSAYGNGWERLTSESKLDLEIPVIYAKRLYRSREGRIAFFSPVVNQLKVYSIGSIEAVKRYESKRDGEKSKVPVF